MQSTGSSRSRSRSSLLRGTGSGGERGLDMNAAAKQAKIPEVIGEDTSLDRICWDEAKAQLGEGATHSEIALLAQQYKTLTLDPPDPQPHGMDLVKAILA